MATEKKPKKKRNSTSITAKSGKEYNYIRITRKIGQHKNKRGLWVSDYKQFTGKTMKEAEAKYQRYMATTSLNGMAAFGEYADWFILNVFNLDVSLKESTKVHYVNDYHRLFDGSPILGRDISEISGLDLQTVINSSASGASTKKQCINFLKRFYTYLDSMNVCKNAAAGLMPPPIEHKRKNQEIEIFPDKELKALLDSTPEDSRIRLLIVLAANTGARIGELLALTYDDISDEQIRINKTLSEIEKNKRTKESTKLVVSTAKTAASNRIIPVSHKVMQEIDQHRKWHYAEMMKRGYRSKYVFTTSSGSLYYRRNVERALKRLCNNIGIPERSWHVFRHTFGSRLASSGVPIQTVSKLMGHDDISVTSKYYLNISTDEKQQAIKALGL